MGSFGLRAIADEQEVSASVGVRLVPTHYATTFLDALSGLESADDEVGVSTIAARARDAIAGASVAAIITGSRADATDIRLAVERLGQGVRSIVVRAHPGAESTVWTGPPAPMVTLGALEDLPRLVRAVTL